MNAIKSIRLMRKFNNCQSCGSDAVGGGKGTLAIEDETFYRSCICGWSIKTDEEGNEVKD